MNIATAIARTPSHLTRGGYPATMNTEQTLTDQPEIMAVIMATKAEGKSWTAIQSRLSWKGINAGINSIRNAYAAEMRRRTREGQSDD